MNRQSRLCLNLARNKVEQLSDNGLDLLPRVIPPREESRLGFNSAGS